MSIVKLCGIWEFNWNVPISECIQWRFPVDDFAVDEWIMTPITGIIQENIKLIEMASIENAIFANPDLTPIHITEYGTNSLIDFKHPENALYILGAAGSCINLPDVTTLKIQTPRNKGLMWPHQAICIILYDRMVKSWQ